jgi:hypothetical protein
MNAVKIFNQQKEVFDLEFGTLYFVFSSISGLQKDFFIKNSGDENKIIFINSFFEGAIKVPIYMGKNQYDQDKVKKLKKEFDVDEFDIGQYGIFNNMLYVMLSELTNGDVMVVETTGLDEMSIIKLAKHSFTLTERNKSKLIITIQNNLARIKYPPFQLEKINMDKIENFENWYNTIGETTIE